MHSSFLLCSGPANLCLKDCGLDTSVDFAEDNADDQRAFANLGKISIICKNSQSPYLKTSKTDQYEIIPCDQLHGHITAAGKNPTHHSLPRVEETAAADQDGGAAATVNDDAGPQA